MRPIDADALLKYLMINMGWHDADGIEVDDSDKKRAIIKDLIDGVPTLDAVPVVRCKDCVYYKSKKLRQVKGSVFFTCPANGGLFGPDDYCSDGKPKEDEHETDLSAPDSCDMALVIAHASDIPIHTERIWMETRAGELWPLQYRYWDGDLLHFLDKYTPFADAVFDAGQYLITWRCWTAKPTNEQREAAKWE